MSKSGISSFRTPLALLGLAFFCSTASAQLLLGAGDNGKAGGGGGGGSTTLAFDATSETGSGNFTGSVGSLTWSHTVDNGSVGNPFLYVVLTTYSGTLRTTSTVTYNGASCSEIDAITAAVESNNQETSHWACSAPAQGAHNIVATFSGTADFAMGMAESLTGAAQSSPIDSHNIAQTVGSTPTSVTISTTVVASNAWLIGLGWARGGGPVVGGAGTTIRLSAGGAIEGIGDSNGTVGTGSQSLVYALTGGGNTWPGYTIASIKHGP